MKCIFLNTYYSAFLREIYLSTPGLDKADYDSQIQVLQDSLFGESYFYSRNLRDAGWEAFDIVVNCAPLQSAWGGEKGIKGHPLALAVERVRRERPEVVYIHDMSIASEALISALRPHTGLIVGQIASPLHPGTFLAGFDLIFTSFLHFADAFRRKGIPAVYQPLAFERSVLRVLPKVERDLDVTFVGGISPSHKTGTEFLENLARLTDLRVWGYGAESLSPNSALSRVHGGPVWGKEMFAILSRSRITINRHTDSASDYANNMRLFEATGCGALLITDFKENLEDLFLIGKEVVAYRSPQECAELIRYYLSHPAEADEIAAAGQARTLRDHSYCQRMRQTARILERTVRRKSQPAEQVNLAGVSCGYQKMGEAEITHSQLDAWRAGSVARAQRNLVEAEISGLLRGVPSRVFSVLVDALDLITVAGSSILEIGCASGYSREILEYFLPRKIDYIGVDYSEAMIAMARGFYPEWNFWVADASDVPFKSQCFDVVVSSGVMLHLLDPERAVRESIRLSRRYVVAHRTPVRRVGEGDVSKKLGYGVEMFERRFNENAFIEMFRKNGAFLVRSMTISADQNSDLFDCTYIFEKIP